MGGGGHAKVIVSLLRTLGHEIAGVLDDDPEMLNCSVLGVPVIGPSERLLQHQAPAAVLAVGDNDTRRRLAERFPHTEWPALVHPEAFVDPSATITAGSVVMAGAVVQADSEIGVHCIVNTNATVDHDCLLGDFVHVASGATLTGGVTLGAGVFFGAGATCLPGMTVGDWSVVGAGAVVNRPIPARSLAKGVPVRHRPL